MTNGEKYKTARERTDAHIEYCNKHVGKKICSTCPLKDYLICSFFWLDLEAEEEKHETIDDILLEMKGFHDAADWLSKPDSWDEENVVEALRHYADRIEAAHNRVAKAVKESEEKK